MSIHTVYVRPIAFLALVLICHAISGCASGHSTHGHFQAPGYHGPPSPYLDRVRKTRSYPAPLRRSHEGRTRARHYYR